MAVSSYGTNHPMAVKVWAKKLFVEALKQTKFSRFLGNTPSSVVQRRTELSKGPGDRITIGLRLQLAQAGIAGDATLEGNEEALALYTDNVFIDQLRGAVRTGGKMSQQRVPFEIREESMEGLRDWWADRLDASFFNQIGGASVNATGPNTTQVTSANVYCGMQAAIAPTASTRIMLGGTQGQANGDLTEASLSATTTYNLNVQDIDRCVARAKTFSPAFRPVKVNGEDKYVMFIHPYQTYTLRKSTATAGQWGDIQKAAMTGGQISNNPLYTGALGEWNGVVLHEDARVPQTQASGGTGITATNSTGWRSIFCGAQAAAFAVGQDNKDGAMTWVEELFDYENQLGVSAGLIFGLKKMVFNSTDFSTLVVTTFAPQP